MYFIVFRAGADEGFQNQLGYLSRQTARQHDAQKPARMAAYFQHSTSAAYGVRRVATTLHGAGHHGGQRAHSPLVTHLIPAFKTGDIFPDFHPFTPVKKGRCRDFRVMVSGAPRFAHVHSDEPESRGAMGSDLSLCPAWSSAGGSRTPPALIRAGRRPFQARQGRRTRRRLRVLRLRRRRRRGRTARRAGWRSRACRSCCPAPTVRRWH